MVDLKERFQALDQVPAPNLERVIELRARHLASVPGALGLDPDAIGGRRFRVPPAHLLAAAAILILGLGLAVILHQARSTAPVRHAPTPTPTAQAPGTSEGGIFPAINMVSLTSGWAAVSGQPGQVLWTADAGKHWADVTPPKEALAHREVQPVFVDVTSAWLLSRPSRSVTPGASGRETVTTDSSGQADIWRTLDAGKTWQRVASLTLAPWFSAAKMAQELRFVDRQHGWLSVWPLSGPGGMILYATTDGGAHWSEISVPASYPGHSTADALPSDCLGGISFTSDRDGWVGAGCSRSDRFFATHDGGVSWKELPVPPRVATFTGSEWHFEGFVSRPRGGNLLFTVVGPANGVGVDHELYASADGGVSWMERPLPQGRYAPGMMGSLSIPPSFIGNRGWILIDGALYLTDDAGVSWQKVAARLTGWENPAEFQFVDASTGWAMAGAPGGKIALLKSSDGGRTWTQQWRSQ